MDRLEYAFVDTEGSSDRKPTAPVSRPRESTTYSERRKRRTTSRSGRPSLRLPNREWKGRTRGNDFFGSRDGQPDGRPSRGTTTRCDYRSDLRHVLFGCPDFGDDLSRALKGIDRGELGRDEDEGRRDYVRGGRKGRRHYSNDGARPSKRFQVPMTPPSYDSEKERDKSRRRRRDDNSQSSRDSSRENRRRENSLDGRHSPSDPSRRREHYMDDSPHDSFRRRSSTLERSRSGRKSDSSSRRMSRGLTKYRRRKMSNSPPGSPHDSCRKESFKRPHTGAGLDRIPFSVLEDMGLAPAPKDRYGRAVSVDEFRRQALSDFLMTPEEEKSQGCEKKTSMWQESNIDRKINRAATRRSRGRRHFKSTSESADNSIISQVEEALNCFDLENQGLLDRSSFRAAMSSLGLTDITDETVSALLTAQNRRSHIHIGDLLRDLQDYDSLKTLQPVYELRRALAAKLQNEYML